MRLALMGLCYVCTACTEPVTCGPNTEEREGNCFGIPTVEVVQPDDPTFVEVLADLEPCRALPPGEELDLDGRCAGGICLFDSVGDAIEVAGEPDCIPSSPGSLSCAWRGVRITTPDADGDGRPEDDNLVEFITVMAPFSQADPNGLGLGAHMSCFLEALPRPTEIGLFNGDDGVQVVEARWQTMDLHVAAGGSYGKGYTENAYATTMRLGSWF